MRTRLAARSTWLALLCFLLALPTIGCGGGSSSNTPVQGPDPGSAIGTTTTPSTDCQEMANRLAAVLALGYNTINPDDVMRRLTGLSGSPLFVVDIRDAADYAAGHIPGAINIPFQSLPKALLDGTHGIPADQDVCVASYWGNDGTMAALLINVFRVEDPSVPANYKTAKALFQGITSWTFERSLVPTGTRFSDATASDVIVSKAVETTVHTGVDQGTYCDFADFGVTDVVEKILMRADLYLHSVADAKDLQMYPSALATLLEDGNAANDPQVVSVRSEAHYALGHIPGAIDIPYKSAADLANYTKFVAVDRPVVAYCYTGHTGGIATMVLGILGYDVRNLLYGMNGWSQTAPASGQLSNFDLMKGWDFPLNTTDGGLTTLAGYTPPSTGCQACHTRLTALWMSEEIDPIPGEEAPPSSGEG